MPDLKEDILLSKINKSISNAKEHSNILVEQTLNKVKQFIETQDYIENLSYEIAWDIITSNNFINSQFSKKFEERKQYFEPLIAGWHQLFLKGTELDFYRLADKYFYAHAIHLPKQASYEKHTQLKENSDIVDSKIIHSIAFGTQNSPFSERCPIICIAMSKQNEKTNIIKILEERTTIIKQTLIDLSRAVDDWNIDQTPGETIVLKINNKGKDCNEIFGSHKIPFNAPFSSH